MLSTEEYRKARNAKMRILKTNKSFAAMTPTQRKVECAKEILRLMKVRNLTSGVGFCDLPNQAIACGKSVKGFISKYASPRDPCRVCAIGGLFVGHVMKFNKLNFDDSSRWQFDARDTVHCELAATFTTSELADIEAAFEGTSLKQDSWDFYQAFYDRDDRLKAVALNIINGKGTFDPSYIPKFKVKS